MRIVVTILTVALLSACTPAPPTASPPSAASSSVDCRGLPQVEAAPCDKMVAAIGDAYPEAVQDAARILVADTCPPQVYCDRAFIYDAAASIVPSGGTEADALLLHVYGHLGQSLDVEPWSGPLPEHVSLFFSRGDLQFTPAPSGET